MEAETNQARPNPSHRTEDAPRQPQVATRPKTTSPAVTVITNLVCYPDIEHMLMDGIDREDIADFIQQDAAELTNYSRDRVIKMLGDMNDALPLLRRVENHIPTFVDEVAKEIETKLDELDELKQLYEMQKSRIRTAVDFEKTMPVLNPGLRSEFAQAESLLKTRHEIKMDLGEGGGRNLGTVGIKAHLESQVAPKYSQEARTAIIDAEKRAKVAALAERLIAVSSRIKEEKSRTIDVTPE